MHAVTCPDCGDTRHLSRPKHPSESQLCRSCGSRKGQAGEHTVPKRPAKKRLDLLAPGRPDFSDGACIGERRFTELALEAQQATCLSCPCLTACADAGVWAASKDRTFKHEGAVWGGVMPKELAAMARARKEAAHV